jgi:hypothetical protein
MTFAPVIFMTARTLHAACVIDQLRRHDRALSHFALPNLHVLHLLPGASHPRWSGDSLYRPDRQLLVSVTRHAASIQLLIENSSSNRGASNGVLEIVNTTFIDDTAHMEAP